MQRLFPDHSVRKQAALDGLWRFLPGAAGAPPADDPPEARPIFVPSCWETLPGFESWRGAAWVYRDIPEPSPRWRRVVFGAVSHTADVFWNGAPVGHHEDAYTPFEVFLPPGAGGRLAVRADNSFGAHAALHFPNDYYSYGGLTRPVTIQEVPDVFISRLHATPRREGAGWALDLKVTLACPDGARPPGARCRVTLNGRTLIEENIEGPEARWTAPVVEAAEWSPATPVLHTLRAALLDKAGRETDDLADRTGFREVRVSGDRILLNGRPLRIRGFNRHEDHSVFGSAIPPAAMAHDLALMREMGANLVRTAHYPNDPRFLDLCDETGMLVWEESHARQISFSHPRALAQSEASTREMLGWHHNHPSIIIWGCLNECDTKSDDGIAFHQKILGLIRAADPSRPVSYAGHLHQEDRCLHLADIVAHNLYPGWYDGGLERIGPHLEEFLAWLDSPASGGAGKPFLVTEFGAGAIHGFRSPPFVKHTEEYQAALLAEAIRIFGGHPRLSGCCVWQFCDCRISEEGDWWMRRPRHINDKGVVTRERARKAAFAAAREAFGTLARDD